MTTYQPTAQMLADFARIEAVIAEHGPCTSHFIAATLQIKKTDIGFRLERMRHLKLAHVSFRAPDASVSVNTVVAHYALGADPGVADERNPKRGKVPFRPVVKTWGKVKPNGDPLHAAFFGRAA